MAVEKFVRMLQLIVFVSAVMSFPGLAGQEEDCKDTGEPGGTRKVVIAHRGASGYLPEHTIAAYNMAYAQGADYLEPDLAMTRDGVLVCLHDMTLDVITDVADVFPGRHREDGKHYVIDFTLDEIRTLHVRERFPGRFPRDKSLFKVVTFEELIKLTQGLNASTGRNVGLYPEIKNPEFYQDAGMPFVESLLRILKQYGYDGPSANVYVQCFVPATLIRMRQELKTTLPLVQLISQNASHDQLVTDEGLKRIAEYAQGIGPNKQRIEQDLTLVERAHQFGLVVHPYTFRADLIPSHYDDFKDELRTFLFKHNSNGAFVDHPDIMKQVIADHQLSTNRPTGSCPS